MGYAHQPCKEDVQPQMGMPNKTMYWNTMLTNEIDWWTKKKLPKTQNAKCKQAKTQHVNCQNKNIITNKLIIYKALSSWKILN